MQTNSQQAGILDVRGPRKTLIICPIGIGNFVMATAALERLSNAIGAENLHLLALKPGIASMAKATGYFADVHGWDPDKEGMARGLTVLASLRQARFDYSIALFPTGDWKFCVFAALAGARRRIGFAYPNSGLPRRLQTMSLSLDPSLHDTDQNYAMVETLLGTTVDTPRGLSFPFKADAVTFDDAIGGDYFVCHPGSSAERGMKEKRLPPKAFGELARLIHQEYGIKCLLVGGPEEEDLRADVRRYAPDVFIERPSRSFADLAGLISGARFYLGNDSGLMHVSVALDKRCIAFFGPTDDRRNGPYSDGLRRGDRDRHLIVRRDDLDCSPCWTIHTVGANPPCKFGDTRCLKDMDVQRVWPKIRDYLDAILAPAAT